MARKSRAGSSADADTRSLLDYALKTVEKASAFVLSSSVPNRVPDLLVDGDLKTPLDNLLHDVIAESLMKSGLPILSEEAPNETDALSELIWVVDPLDGTLNYSRRLGPYCVSVALVRRGAPEFGVVWTSDRNRVFWGGRKMGAWCEGERLGVSERDSPSISVLATGKPNALTQLTVKQLTLMETFWRVRMFGSAAYSLTRVADGGIDAYFEEAIQLWDVAAGIALVEAAGGIARIKFHGIGTRCSVIASNGKLFLEF